MDIRLLLFIKAPLPGLTKTRLAASLGQALALEAYRAMAIYAPRAGDQIVTGCSGCVTQLRAAAPKDITVGHWLELIG